MNRIWSQITKHIFHASRSNLLSVRDPNSLASLSPFFKSCPAHPFNRILKQPIKGCFNILWCAGQDLNLRSPKARVLQTRVIDRSTTDAIIIKNFNEQFKNPTSKNFLQIPKKQTFGARAKIEILLFLKLRFQKKQNH